VTSVVRAGLLVGVTCLLAPAVGRGQESDGLSDLSLEELLDVQVVVATRSARGLRESPGIVTVVGREEIARSGARDLIDVLRLVPGLQLGADVEGVVGLSVRGIWAHEGKVLLLVDGVEVNERMFATLQLGHHLPVSHIARLEVMRGPGSAVYGGYAELAVINVVTRGPRDLEGTEVGLTWGQRDRGFGHASVSLQTATTVGEDLGVSAAVFVGEGRRSDRRVTDLYGGRARRGEGVDLDPRWANLGLTWGDLSVRVLYDRYETSMGVAYDEVLSEPERMSFDTLIADASYRLELAPELTVTPRLGLTRQSPWRSESADPDVFYDKTATRLLAGVSLVADPGDGLHLLGGVEGFADHAVRNSERVEREADTVVGGRSFTFYQGAAYAQVQWDTSIVNVLAGVRYDHSSAFGGALVPRLGLTRRLGAFHSKLLASRAFRAPSLENLTLSPDIEPELTTVLEAEVGWEPLPHVLLTANVFDITIEHPIVFEVVEGETEGSDLERYSNYDRTGSRGLELDLRVCRPRGSLRASYSYFQGAGKNEVGLYRVPGEPDAFVGFARHKLAARGHLVLWRTLSLAPSAVFLTERPAFNRAGGDGTPQLGEESPLLLLDVMLRYEDLVAEGLALDVGVHDLLDSGYRFVQPYDGGHAPLPGPSREYLVRLTWSIRY